MTMMSDLPRDLKEEILSRVSLTSTRAVRSTCRDWNTLSRDVNFTKKHIRQAAAAKEREGKFPAIVTLNYSVYLMSVNLHGGIQNSSDPTVKPEGKLISLNDSDKVDISRVCHCDGLLLCTTRDYTKLVVWNPYTGETRWICVKPKSKKHRVIWYGNALGYKKSKHCRTHKILRFLHTPPRQRPVHEIYELKTNSWRVLDVTADWEMDYNFYGLSLKGNTYWFAYDRKSVRGLVPDFLLCFDFTRERFGPRLPLPFRSYYDDSVILSSVREEQLAVLFQRWNTIELEVWVTTKIKPNAVAWRNLLKVDMEPITDFQFYRAASFLIDEERGPLVVIEQDKDKENTTRNTAYIIGENGYYREVDLGETTTGTQEEGFPLACSYIPSSVRIN